MTSILWPKESECEHFYGDPIGKNARENMVWKRSNLTTIKPPFRMTYAGKPVSSLQVHRKCSESLLRILNALWLAAGKKQKVIDEWGVSIYGGIYSPRLKRNANTMSMHAYACAIDLDPARNSLGDTTPRFANFPQVVKCFTDEGWVWLGKHDGMHFQAARLN
jgi:D-alanyl-D-alanine carboxypeptidase